LQEKNAVSGDSESPCGGPRFEPLCVPYVVPEGRLYDFEF